MQFSDALQGQISIASLCFAWRAARDIRAYNCRLKIENEAVLEKNLTDTVNCGIIKTASCTMTKKTKLMEQLHFNYRDIFRAIRYGFSGRKIAVHFAGIFLAYVLYETLVYITLFIQGGPAEARAFWNTHVLNPITPFMDEGLTDVTRVAMWIGVVCFAGIFFLASTIASKITIEQLRGDYFFSVGDAAKFVTARWKTVFGAFIGLLFIFLFLALIPLSIAALAKIPVVGKPILTLAAVLMPFGFFLGLLMAFICVVFLASLFFVPAVVATTGADAFETIYQQFAIVWHQLWRMVRYELLLFLLKLFFVPIWGFFCLCGVAIVLLPIGYLHLSVMTSVLVTADDWLDGLLFMSPTLPSGGDDFWITAAAVCFTIGTIGIVCLILAFLFAIASAGNTLIYILLRKGIDGQNLLHR